MSDFDQAALRRWSYLVSLWRERLWGRWFGLAYAGVTAFVFVRDDFWRPANSSKWALVNLLPSLTIAWWLLGAALLIAVWLFEASFRLHKTLGDQNRVIKAELEQKPQRTPEQEGKYRAARAVLPATLDAVFDYVKASVWWLKDVREKAGLLEQRQYNTAVAVPTSPRPDAVVTQLRDGVEYLDPEIANHISEILRLIQVQRARISSLEDYFGNHVRQGSSRAGLVRDLDQFTADSVKIAALARQLYPYARQQDDGPIQPLDCPFLEATFRECQLDVCRDTLAWNIFLTPYLKATPYIYPEIDELEESDG